MPPALCGTTTGSASCFSFHPTYVPPARHPVDMCANRVPDGHSRPSTLHISDLRTWYQDARMHSKFPSSVDLKVRDEVYVRAKIDVLSARSRISRESPGRVSQLRRIGLPKVCGGEQDQQLLQAIRIAARRIRSRSTAERATYTDPL